MVAEVISCPHCGSDDACQKRLRPNGKQKIPLPCWQASKSRGSFSQRLHLRAQGGDPARLPRAIEFAEAQAHLRCLAHHGYRLAQKGAGLDLEDTLFLTEAARGDQVLQLDEPWSLIYRKSDKAWVWLALCRETRQVVAFVTGERSRASCERLWEALPKSYKGASCYSDFLWEAYGEVIPEEQHEATGKEEGETCHVERWVNTLRQRLSHFVRKTLAFSKSRQMHYFCLKLFIHRYNLERGSTIL